MQSSFLVVLPSIAFSQIDARALLSSRQDTLPGTPVEFGGGDQCAENASRLIDDNSSCCYCKEGVVEVCYSAGRLPGRFFWWRYDKPGSVNGCTLECRELSG
jgi:hypothetical protein